MTHRASRITPPRRGFTLVEILVAVAIMIALVAILLPSLSHVKKFALTKSAHAQLGLLQTALANYNQFFHTYPSSSTPGYVSPSFPTGVIASGRGSAMLAQGLNGYLNGDLDGAGTFSSGNSDTSEYGFRMTNNPKMGGTVYGPYGARDPKGYRVNTPNSDECFIDPWGNEILYYRSTQVAPVSYIKPNRVFDSQSSINASSGSATPNSPGTTALFCSDDCLVNRNPNATSTANPNPATAASSAFFNLLNNIAPGGTSTNTQADMGTLGHDSFLLISGGINGQYFDGDDIVESKQ